MRLWHKDLIPYLPKQQLVAQWREILAIKGAIDKNGTPNHRLVNRLLYYDISHFKTYSTLIYTEMINRNYKPSELKYKLILTWSHNAFEYSPNYDELYEYWHDSSPSGVRYLRQCYYNLQEKYDCGIVPIQDWIKIENKFGGVI